mgnify:FL=1
MVHKNGVFMNPKRLWQVSVVTAAEAEEAVAALLERVFGHPPSVYAHLESKISTATVYSTKPAAWLRAKKGEVTAGLQIISDCGLRIEPGQISLKPVLREDWTESWKKYFKTIEIGSALLIKPSWSKRKPRSNQALVVLDPGMSFGTGQHPTTSFCLRQLVRCRKPGQQQSFLDIGSGSGILSIAAAKLGYAPVRAFDCDPVAVRVAQANARMNKVEDQVCITRTDLRRLPLAAKERYDVICANLVDDLLISQAERVSNRLKANGKLILAGILVQQFPSVQRTYARLGFRLQVSRTDREWQSGVFECLLQIIKHFDGFFEQFLPIIGRID